MKPKGVIEQVREDGLKAVFAFLLAIVLVVLGLVFFLTGDYSGGPSDDCWSVGPVTNC